MVDEADWREALRGHARRWLVTGAAGFIGSHLVEVLLAHGQTVIALDDFSTGRRTNLDAAMIGAPAAGRLTVIEGDIRDAQTCAKTIDGVDIVLHQAALGSVPRSIAEPVTTHDVNVTGFLNILEGARRAGVTRVVYAASSATYGDDETLPKVEDRIGKPLSPYAASKLVDEIYAQVYHRSYGSGAVGLRYFNVFGPRQDPDGAYAAVIPRWIAAMRDDAEVTINGDGQTSRDFCFVANVVEANIRAALAGPAVEGEVFNIAMGEQTSLIELFALIRSTLQARGIDYRRDPVFAPTRAGDVRHSLADIGKARRMLGYDPAVRVAEGMVTAVDGYLGA